MTDVLTAIKDAFLPLVPVLVGALVAAVVAWLGRLKLLASVREAMADSAVRQATETHGSDPAAFQAAADELNRIPASMRPKDVPAAVERAVDRERLKRASMAPAEPSGPISPHYPEE
jgi:hypothetical protein